MNEDSELKWITKEEALYIHETTIDRHGGLSGIRDNGLLESALARPESFYTCGEQETFILAASYADGIARNHPFADGNKRTAYGVAGLFLHENGYDLGIKDEKNKLSFLKILRQGIYVAKKWLISIVIIHEKEVFMNILSNLTKMIFAPCPMTKMSTIMMETTAVNKAH